MTKWTLFVLSMVLALSSAAWAETRTIAVVNGEKRVEFELNGTSVADSLWNQLPFSVSVENYGSNEKIFHPAESLDTSNVQEGDCPAGTLAYFSPWGNLVMYYGPASRYPGLYILGHAVSGAESIGSISGTIELSRVENEQEKSSGENISSTGNTSSGGGGGGGCNLLSSLAAPLSLFVMARHFNARN